MKARLRTRLARLERDTPTACPACGRVSTIDNAYSTLMLFDFEGQLLRSDCTVVARADLAPCPSCGQPKERCCKIIVGVDPMKLFGE